MKELSDAEITEKTMKRLFFRGKEPVIRIGTSHTNGNVIIRLLVDNEICELYTLEKEYCELCETHSVNALYSYIVSQLKKKGLLEENFKKKCCFCQESERFIKVVWSKLQ